MEIFLEYTKRYGPSFPDADLLGLDAVVNFLRSNTVFCEVRAEGASRWCLGDGIKVPVVRDVLPVSRMTAEEYSAFDTPPGQKGSRVFESPKAKLVWSSPPASALPQPTALLGQDRRRMRLAAQFDAANIVSHS
ncbi:unnamed protein product [Leptidea sinapis]|uniref:Uncharacterized protein n=3 Tax=Leptidea sinapis TaxID=189913 RepID=A0A5E4R2J7_9NEOP|nr:unnamed protein product [Leptidea sinapis]